MSNALTRAIDAIPEEVLDDVGEALAELVHVILAAPDRRTAIERAKFYAAADAAKIAADAALRKDLG